MIPRLLHTAFIFLSAIICNSLFAQSLNPRYNFKHLNVQNGLAQNIVYHFLQDTHGYMWIGTRNGLTLYDGVRTINFFHDEKNETTISSNFITRILEDAQHRVWIGTDVGICLYNRADNSFSNFNVLTVDNKKEKTFCVPLGFINKNELWYIEPETKSVKSFDVRTKSTRLLAATSAVDGVLRYDSVSHTHHLWTYLSTGTIHYIFKGDSLTKKEFFFTDENKKDNKPVMQVVHVLPQNDSVTWLSTLGGLVELNPLSGKYITYNELDKQPIKELRYTAIGPSGLLLWIATGNHGAYTFDLKTKKFIDNFRNFRLDPFSICSNNIVSLYFDRTGNIWCGSYGGGVSYTNVLKNYFQKNLSRNKLDEWEGNKNIHWIGYDNNNNLWCLMNDVGGLWKLNKKTHLFEHRVPVLEDGKKFTNTIEKLLFEGDRFAWCAGNSGLFQYELSTNRLHKLTYPILSSDLFGSNWIKDMIRLKDQSLLFTTYGGLYRITFENGKYFIQPFSELNKRKHIGFGNLCEDENGTIYVKDVGDFLYILERSKEQMVNPAIRSIRFIPDVNQYYVDSTKNRLLLATNYGLYQLDRKDYSLAKVNTAKPIPFLSISSILKTHNKLWLFGEKGLFCWDEKNATARTYTVEDGLPSNEFNESAIHYSASGECIAGTTNGLVSFFPSTLQDTLYPPLAQLTNIFVNDAPTGFVPNPQETKKINLSHQQNTFSFEFSPIAFHHAAECTFEYKLVGYDKDWIKSGATQYTRYSKIPPGTYSFLLHVSDANGKISPYDKTLEIEIGKAFWQTNLFRIAISALILLLAWFAVKLWLHRKIRMQRQEFEKQQAIEKERTRIATDMHDDLGAGLSRIKYLSESIQSKKGNNESITSEVVKIASYSDEMVEKMGEIVWALNEKNDTLADLVAFTRSYAADYLSNNNIQCVFHTPETLPTTFVTGEIRRNIFLSVKEALHNVVKHAQASVVTIIVVIDNHLQFIIHDDGVGIDWNHIRPFSNGLTNIQKRMVEIGGKAAFENKQGTKIILNVPFEE